MAITFIFNEAETSRFGDLRGGDANDGTTTLPVAIDALQKNFKDISESLSNLFDQTKSEEGGFGLQEVNVELGISATGKVGFLGSGVEASGVAKVNVKFVRTQNA